MSVAVSGLPCRAPRLRPSVGEIETIDIESKTATIGVANNSDHEGASLDDIQPTSDGARPASPTRTAPPPLSL
eukprot:6882784-Prymnesium_polylepis.1